MAGASWLDVRSAGVFRVALLMSLASLSATSADGQELRPIRPPVAVRVWTSDSGVTRPIVGNALAQDSSILRVGVANQVELAIRLAMIDSLQLRRTIRAGKGWRYGTLGALIGARCWA